jgi:hypothetical protein
VSHGGIDRDDEIHVHQRGRGFAEIGQEGLQAGKAQISAQISRPCALLKPKQLSTGELRQPPGSLRRKRAVAVILVTGISGPGQTDLPLFSARQA